MNPIYLNDTVVVALAVAAASVAFGMAQRIKQRSEDLRDEERREARQLKINRLSQRLRANRTPTDPPPLKVLPRPTRHG